MRIRKQVLKKITESIAIKVKLAEETGRHYMTIERWVETNHSNLTNASALKVIREQLGLTDDQILEETKHVA